VSTVIIIIIITIIIIIIIIIVSSGTFLVSTNHRSPPSNHTLCMPHQVINELHVPRGSILNCPLHPKTEHFFNKEVSPWGP
jgi:hypothetical protein